MMQPETSNKTYLIYFRKFLPAIVIFLSISGMLFLGELVARFVVNPGDFLMASMEKDPVLGHRIKPGTTGHDSAGFRNESIPDQAEIITLGDSMTYGFGVTREDNWPYQLGLLLGKSVYNMGMGGYGPLQYHYLASHEAVKLKPKKIIVGFYLGNDLFDAYNITYSFPYWAEWRNAGVANKAETVLTVETQDSPKKFLGSLRGWLSRHSVLYSMLRVIVFPRLALWEQESMAKNAAPDDWILWEDPKDQKIHTIFTPKAMLNAMDLNLPKVQESLSLTKRAFGAIKNDAASQGARLLIVFIPTKETVYCDYLKKSGTIMSDSYSRLCEIEPKLKTVMADFFRSEHIEYVDVIGKLEQQVEEHMQIYPFDSDGHPQAKGHRVIAKAIFEALQKQY